MFCFYLFWFNPSWFCVVIYSGVRLGTQSSLSLQTSLTSPRGIHDHVLLAGSFCWSTCACNNKNPCQKSIKNKSINGIYVRHMDWRKASTSCQSNNLKELREMKDRRRRIRVKNSKIIVPITPYFHPMITHYFAFIFTLFLSFSRVCV